MSRVFGVRGMLEVLEEEVDEAAAAATFMSFVGREGDACFCGVDGFPFDGVDGLLFVGVAGGVMCEDLGRSTLKALALDGVLSVSSDGLALSEAFSDDPDTRREEVGESDFLGGPSWMMDLGRYLGRPDDAPGRGRRVRVTVPTAGGDAASAGLARPRAVDPLLRVTVFESGESTLVSGEVTSLVAREAVAAR